MQFVLDYPPILFSTIPTASFRHTNFAGSYQIKGMKAVCPSNDAVSHRVVTDPNRLSWIHERKVGKRTAKNRLPAVAGEKDHRSALSVRKVLRDLCVGFLERCYNSIMRSARSILNRNRDALGKISVLAK